MAEELTVFLWVYPKHYQGVVVGVHLCSDLVPDPVELGDSKRSLSLSFGTTAHFEVWVFIPHIAVM